MAGLEDELAALRPIQDEKIMDLVASAGIDVTPWAFTQGGRPVKTPRSNPNYCYEWAFGGGQEPTVLCIWHRSIKIVEGKIGLRDSVRQYALRLDPLTFDRAQPSHVRSRARDQAKRARHFDSLLQKAYRRNEPVRIVVLDGEAKDRSELGWDASKVDARRLDPAPWYVHAYNDQDGYFEMVRGLPAVTGQLSDGAQQSASGYVDQFSLPPPQDKVLTSGTAYPRSKEVRQRALSRAAGRCELCGEHGFVMHSGALYLETHHVIPLSENGPDVEWNVAVLCSNDHRRAHFSSARDEIKARLTEHLKNKYPAAIEALNSLTSKRAFT